MNNVIQNELKIVSKNVGLSAFYYGIGYPLSIIIGIVVAKLVGAENLGLITIGLSFVQLLAFFSLLGTNRGLLKYVAYYSGLKDILNIKRIIKFALTCSVSLSIIFILIYLEVGDEINILLFPNIKNISAVIMFFVLLLPVIVLKNSFKGCLAGLQRPQYDRIQEKIIFPISRILILFLLVQFFTILTSILVATIISIIISTTFLLLILIKELQTFNKEQCESSNLLPFKEFIIFSLPLILVPLFNLATHSIDTLIVSHYLSAASTGVYAIVRKLGFFVALPLSLFTSMIAASAAKMYTTDHFKEFEKIYRYTTKWIIFFSSIIFSIIFIHTQEILNLIGKDFATGTIPLKIFLFSQLINAFVGPTGNTLLMTNGKNIFIINSSLSIIIGIGSSFYLIPLFGLIGAAISISLAFSIVNILCVFSVIRGLNIYPMGLKQLLYRLCAIIIALLMSYFINRYLDLGGNLTVIRIFISSSLGIFVIIFFYVFIEKFQDEDKYIIKKILNKVGIQKKFC